MRRLGALLAALAMFMGMALPAAAGGIENGVKSGCVWYLVGIHSYTTGTTKHYDGPYNFPPTTNRHFAAWNNGGSWTTRNGITMYNDQASWKVTTTGSLDAPNTYGYCSVFQ